MKDKLLLAIPKKGRLNEETELVLRQAGIQYKKSFRSDIAFCQKLPLGLVFLPSKDITNYVSKGDVDLGITGKDLVLESGLKVIHKMDLNYGKCDLCILSTDKKILQKKEKLRIATSYPNLTKKFFQKKNQKVIITHLSGSVEIACALGLADMIVDLVETGETIKAMKLQIIDNILQSEACLIANTNSRHQQLLQKIFLRIQGVCKANSFCMIEYNILRKNLKHGEKITPGSTSPTIMPLENKDWVAIKSLIKKELAIDIMEQLEKIGAKDILIYNLQNCRI